MDVDEGNIPDFDLSFMWDDNFMPMVDFSDEELIKQLNVFEAEQQHQPTPAMPAVLPPPPPPQAPQKDQGKGEGATKPKKRRFASCTEAELQSLEEDRHEKKTKDNTAWAVRLFRGKQWCTTVLSDKLNRHFRMSEITSARIGLGPHAKWRFIVHVSSCTCKLMYMHLNAYQQRKVIQCNKYPVTCMFWGFPRDSPSLFTIFCHSVDSSSNRPMYFMDKSVTNKL